MTNQEWRVLDGEGNEQGPYSFQDLQGYYTTGNITHETMVWTEGLDQWVPAGHVQGLLPEALPIVPLAAATPAPADPPAQAPQVGGINLNPQVTVSNSSSLAGGDKKGAPAWLSIITIASGAVAFILYFFPWVSVSQDVSPTIEEKTVKIFTQTGMQSLTGEKNLTNSFAGTIPEFTSSTLNLIAMIAIGIAIVLGLIGLLNKISMATTGGQVLLTCAGLLIGIQMAKQFPIIESYTTKMEKQNELAAAKAKADKENPPELVVAPPKKEKDPAAEAGTETAKADSAPSPGSAEGETITIARKINTSFKTSFEPSCYITVGILALSIFLVVITMSSSSSTTLIIPQGGFQSPQAGAPPQQAPEQPQQPGAGLRFH